MNFLKVKNLIFVFLCSFFSMNIVFARELHGSIYTRNIDRSNMYSSSFNFFEETKNMTPFMENLYKYGHDFPVEIAEELQPDLTGGAYGYEELNGMMYSILSVSDFLNIYEANYSIKDCDSLVISSNEEKDFKVEKAYNYFSSNSFFRNGFDFDDVHYVILFSSSVSGSNDVKFIVNIDNFELYSRSQVVLLFDELGVPIGYFYDSVMMEGNYYLHYRFDFDKNNADMTSWYGYIFKDIPGYIWSSGNSLPFYYNKIYPEKFYLDSSSSTSVSTNAGYTGISGWFKSLFSSNVDLTDYNLRFIYDDVFYNSSYSLSKQLSLTPYNLLFDEFSVSVPDNYTKVNLSNYEKGLVFIPKKNDSCMNNEFYNFYYSISSSISSDAIYNNILKYDSNLGQMNVISKVGMYSNNAFLTYGYDVFSDIDVGIQDSEFYDYGFWFYSFNSKRDYYLMYNNDCYSVSFFNTNSSVGLTFDSGSLTLTYNQIDDLFQNETVNGKNYVWGSTTTSKGSSNPNVENASIIDGENKYSDDNFLTNALNDVPGFLTGIYSSIVSLVGLTSVFLNGLPSFILNFFYAVFTIGMVVLIIKILRG